MRFDFQYMNLDIKATCEYDVREDGKYVGEIEFEVYNELGEDITCEVTNKTSLDIHQRVVELAHEERDLHLALGGSND